MARGVALRQATGWEILSDAEQVLVFRRLLHAHPELRADPFVVRLRRLADIGLREAATEVGAGVLLGLSQAGGDDECAIFFEPNFAGEHAATALADMEEAGLDVEGLDDFG